MNPAVPSLLWWQGFLLCDFDLPRGAIFECASKVYAYAQSSLSWFSVGSVFDVQLCAVEGAYALHDG